MTPSSDFCRWTEERRSRRREAGGMFLAPEFSSFDAQVHKSIMDMLAVTAMAAAPQFP
jgi:hypothetical protein